MNFRMKPDGRFDVPKSMLELLGAAKGCRIRRQGKTLLVWRDDSYGIPLNKDGRLRIGKVQMLAVGLTGTDTVSVKLKEGVLKLSKGR